MAELRITQLVQPKKDIKYGSSLVDQKLLGLLKQKNSIRKMNRAPNCNCKVLLFAIMVLRLSSVKLRPFINKMLSHLLTHKFFMTSLFYKYLISIL